MNDLDILESAPYKDMLKCYSRVFSLGHLNTDINNKFALISLICYVTYKAREKNPDVTHYSIILKITKGMDLPINFLKAVAVICNDFGYGCTEFPLFNLKGKDILKAIKEIFDKYVPF